MPNPAEICAVTIGGTDYRGWTHVSVNREFGTSMSRATLKIVEGANGNLKDWRSIKVGVGSEGTITLGGQTIMRGVVDTRQAALSEAGSAVQVDFVSYTVAAVEGSAPVKPGEYKKYSFEQIARSMLGEVGVGLRVLGAIPELAKPFLKFSVIPGETIFAALDRLARFRNVFFTDNAEGDLVVGRGAPGSAPSLVEGVNIKSASLRMSNPWLAEKVRVDASRSGTDENWGDAARTVSATGDLTGSPVRGERRIQAEMAGDADDMRMRADNEVANYLATSVECTVVVQGWFASSGKLWIEHIGEDIMVVSDRLFPAGRMGLKLRSVTHTQDPGQSGTETQLLCCHPGGFGDRSPTQSGPITPPFGSAPAKQDGNES